MRNRNALPSQTAALAGIPSGVQAIGPWAGRRQLFVRFAEEAETATMFTADALKGEIARLASRSRYHSIAFSGRDPLAESEYIASVLAEGAPLPVLLEHDGQRPDALEPILHAVEMCQVVLCGTETDVALERAYRSIGMAARAQVQHALVFLPVEGVSDGVLLRIVEKAHAASPETSVVVHPTGDGLARQDRRWFVWLERATALHDDVRLLPQIPTPTGTR